MSVTDAETQRAFHTTLECLSSVSVTASLSDTRLGISGLG